MAIWGIVVGVAKVYPPTIDEYRYVVTEADSALEADLIACQVAASHDCIMPVFSLIVEWEE